MPNNISNCTILNNGIRMPWLGIGMWQVEDERVVIQSILSAIKSGYRSIDTATIYGNEASVGEAIKQSGLPREELFTTTKVWNADQGYEPTLKAFEESRKKLDLEYVDLYLIHWPVKGKYKDTWRALERLYKDGIVRAIGVSNFHIHHLKDIMADSEIVPMVDQVEFHPLLSHKELRSFCKANGIQFEAWSPLMQGNLNSDILKELGRKYGKSPAQIVLRWDLQHEVVTIPKSVHEHRIIENAGIFDFELSKDDMERIDGMNIDKRFGPDPDNFDF